MDRGQVKVTGIPHRHRLEEEDSTETLQKEHNLLLVPMTERTSKLKRTQGIPLSVGDVVSLDTYSTAAG
jgi:hypothetical protein